MGLLYPALCFPKRCKNKLIFRFMLSWVRAADCIGALASFNGTAQIVYSLFASICTQQPLNSCATLSKLLLAIRIFLIHHFFIGIDVANL